LVNGSSVTSRSASDAATGRGCIGPADRPSTRRSTQVPGELCEIDASQRLRLVEHPGTATLTGVAVEGDGHAFGSGGLDEAADRPAACVVRIVAQHELEEAARSARARVRDRSDRVAFGHRLGQQAVDAGPPRVELVEAAKLVSTYCARRGGGLEPELSPTMAMLSARDVPEPVRIGQSAEEPSPSPARRTSVRASIASSTARQQVGAGTRSATPGIRNSPPPRCGVAVGESRRRPPDVAGEL
jgi:hypothetical protein